MLRFCGVRGQGLKFERTYFVRGMAIALQHSALEMLP